jgi:DNA-binding response OmpR family regulator
VTNERGKPLVLIVEDDPMIASTLEMVLVDQGYEVAGPAATVEDALQALQATRPDAALLDYRLGGSTTEPLLDELQQRQIPVCMLTGYDRSMLPERYRHLPVLEKPFGMADLLRELRQLCG